MKSGRRRDQERVIGVYPAAPECLIPSRSVVSVALELHYVSLVLRRYPAVTGRSILPTIYIVVVVIYRG